LQIEDEGGYLKAFKSGSIQKLIKETAATRDMNIALRKDLFVGINKYQNLLEKVQDDFDAGIAFPKVNWIEKIIAEPLIKYRGASAFEEVRIITEQNKSGIPKVFLLTYGNQMWRKARAEFATSFFGCGGFEVIDNPGFETLDEGIEAAWKTQAKIIVLCSSDEEYPVIGPEAFEKLREEIILVIAGYPRDSVEKLKSKGIVNYIHIKSNVLEELRKYQKLLGM
jgi:methylmalonyl-CoA mutase